MSNHTITLQKAIEMTTLYRNQKKNLLKPEFQQMDILGFSETFSRDAFDTLLAEEGCEKIRIYYGMSENFDIHAIVVGVNDKDEDILPTEATTASENSNTPDTSSPIIIEEAAKCPPICPPKSPLNP